MATNKDWTNRVLNDEERTALYNAMNNPTDDQRLEIATASHSDKVDLHNGLTGKEVKTGFWQRFLNSNISQENLEKEKRRDEIRSRKFGMADMNGPEPEHEV